MGNNPPKKFNVQNVSIPQSNQVDPKFEEFIKQAFANGAQNGKLYKDKFNDALAVLENFNIKRLRYTPLGERLFNIFDKDKQNYVSEQDFLEGLNYLIKDKDKRIWYTYKAYDRDSDNKISRKEFIEFIEDSWKAAFMILGENVNKKQMNTPINVQKLNMWAQQNKEQLSQQVGKLFSSLDITNKGFIDFTTFSQWVKQGDMHSIFAELDKEVVEVPINLYQIEKQ